MTRPGVGNAHTAESWRYRLLHSPEWRRLLADYRQALADRAIAGGFDSASIAEMARDLKGLEAFNLWCQNQLAIAAREGRIDGRASRYKQARAAAGEGEPAGIGSGAGIFEG